MNNLTKQMREIIHEISQDNDTNDVLDFYYINVILIACSLFDLATINGRKIEQNEMYWFYASYHMNFQFTSGQHKRLLNMYENLVHESLEKKIIFI